MKVMDHGVLYLILLHPEIEKSDLICHLIKVCVIFLFVVELFDSEAEGWDFTYSGG